MNKGFFLGSIYDTCLILLLSIFIIGPLLTDNWIMVGESRSQILRLVELDRGLREGSLYPRWLGDFAGGFGYPYFVFYAPLIYYIAEYFHILGIGIVGSLKCMIALGIILSGIGAYLFARQMWGRYAGIVSALAYVYVPYRLVNLYIRGDFAEAFAMSILPFVLHFFYNTVKEKNLLWLLGAVVSYAALVLTHNCTALIFTGFLLIFLLLISMELRSVSGYVRGLIGMAWGLGLSAVFWLPALMEKKWVNIHLIFSDGAVDFHNNFVDPFRFFYPSWTLNDGIGGRELPLQLGVPHAILTAIAVYFLINSADAGGKRRHPTSVLMFAFFILLALFFTNVWSVMAWEHLPLMKYLQFPWRFLSAESLFISLAAGSLFYFFNEESKVFKDLLAIVLILVIVVYGSQHCLVKGFYSSVTQEYLTPEAVREDGGSASTFNTNSMDSVMAYGEYLPQTVKSLPDKKAAGRIFSVKSRAQISNVHTYLQEFQFETQAEEDSEIVVGAFYYPTWQGLVDDKPLELFTDDHGLIHFIAPSGHHRIEIFFGESRARQMASLISLCSLIILVGMALIPLKRTLQKRWVHTIDTKGREKRG